MSFDGCLPARALQRQAGLSSVFVGFMSNKLLSVERYEHSQLLATNH